MFHSSAIEGIEIKDERQGCVFDDSEETEKCYSSKSIKMEEYESDLEEIHHCSVAVRKLLDTQNVLKQKKVTKPSTCDKCNFTISHKSYRSFNTCGTCNLIKNNLVAGLEDNSGKNLTRKEGFRRYLKKQFFCEVCDYKCTRNSSLQVHLRIHSGEKPFSCKICDYKCTDKRNLQRHLRIHTGERPYLCNMCNYKCADKSSLRIHLRIHTGDKPFVCEYCDYKSIDKRNLRRHLAIHTGEKPHSCEICNYKTVNKRNLLRHLKVHKFTLRNVEE